MFSSTAQAAPLPLAGALLRRAGLALLAGLAACSSGDSGGSGPSAEAPADLASAARFLARATFGATEAESAKLLTLGYDAWFDEQVAAPISLQRPTLEGDLLPLPEDVFKNDVRRKEIWWSHVVDGPDQLRQRLAWALAQIFVVSTRDMEVFDTTLGVAEYYDILARGAFGNYRELLEQVTLSPIMGMYLDMLKNQAGNPAENLRPDENYAREILQLFSIGLVRLNPDGSQQLDDRDEPIPTYDQPVVEGFARVFTGWSFGPNSDFLDTPEDQLGRGVEPMAAFAEFHEAGEKLLLDGFVLPAGGTPESDLEAALDQIAAHPNVGPFIGRQLIQRLVTSNPSPEYVARVSAVWADDGQGQRGNLEAVARAILLDPEALLPLEEQPANFGRLSEPLLRQVALWRAFEAEPQTGVFVDNDLMGVYAQGPLEALTVFNFYAPDYTPKGAIENLGLKAPEFQITTHEKIATTTNRLYERVARGFEAFPFLAPEATLLSLQGWTADAAVPSQLVERLNTLLMGGSMTDKMRNVLEIYLGAVPMDYGAKAGYAPGLQRVVEAVSLIITSPEGVWLH